MLKEEKSYLEIETNNLTFAEILRNYLWKNKNVVFAGWKREHPTKPIIIIVKTNGGAKKIVKDAIEDISKDLEKIKKKLKEIKKEKTKWKGVAGGGKRDGRCDGSGKEKDWKERKEEESRWKKEQNKVKQTEKILFKNKFRIKIEKEKTSLF